MSDERTPDQPPVVDTERLRRLHEAAIAAPWLPEDVSLGDGAIGARYAASAELAAEARNTLPGLLDEVEALRRFVPAECERCKGAGGGHVQCGEGWDWDPCGRCGGDGHEPPPGVLALRAEVEALQAERDQLRAALRELRDAFRECTGDYPQELAVDDLAEADRLLGPDPEPAPLTDEQRAARADLARRLAGRTPVRRPPGTAPGVVSALTLPDGELRSITIRQPWASLIAHGAKTVETRPRPTSYRGPVLIHAGASADTWHELDAPSLASERAAMDAVLRAFDLIRPDGSWFSPFVDRDAIDLGPDVSLPLGAIVAVANVVDCVPILHVMQAVAGLATSWPNIQTNGPDLATLAPAKGAGPSVDLSGERPFGDFTPGRYGLLLADVVRLPDPVPARGHQAVPWRVPEDVAAQVRVHLAEVAR